jgi:3-phosphoinositide dependent protein kinase-1
VIEYAPNGCLADLLEVNTKFPLILAKQYTAELVNTLEYLHSKGIAHRDLKPANIMLSEHFHLKLGDFGTAKFMTDKVISGQVVNHKGHTFVGSSEYVSPEVLSNRESGPASDLWALGCIVYQFFTGNTPFTEKTEYLIFQAILKGEYVIPEEVPADAASLIRQLLVVDPSQRLGNGSKDSLLSYEKLKKHEFFEGVDFDEVGKQDLHLDKDIIMKLQERKKVDTDNEESFEESIKVDTKPTILKEGIISQKTGLFFYNKRKVMLISKPELICYELDKKANKSVIELSRSMNIIMSGRKFEIKIGKTTYKFEGPTQSETAEWVKSIKEAVDTYCPT